MYKDILLSVSKPTRYIGHEINSIRKDLSGIKTKVALIFPDAYEIGMSHLGLKILYHIINNIEDAAAERVYIPWIDLEDVLRKKGLPLVSLESSMPVGEFDILGFTLPYELCYTNILTALSLSGIPLYSSERSKEHPLVIGGGTAVFNPEPIADFFDAFFLGDGEDGIVDIVTTYNSWKDSGDPKQTLLRQLTKIEGIYVPSFYRVEYNGDGNIKSIQPEDGIRDKVKRRIIEDLDKAPYPISAPVPYMQTIHDRLTVEIMRGCTHGCRFCQAGITYRPVRERTPEKILELIERSLKNTGYEEVSLSSLSTGDFACLSNLLKSLNDRYCDERVAFSLPSLRIGTINPEIIEQVTSSKNSSFTIAPEAGTSRLRAVINKEMDEGQFETTVDDLFRRGVKSLKMYFMIGIPTEVEEDLQGIIDLAKKARDIGRKYGKGMRDITVSASTFVPKSHTPFQWFAQTPVEGIKEKIDFLKMGLKRIKVNFKWHKLEMSLLEAVFSRGDRRLGKVIEAAWNAGCRFDSWTERLNFQKWKEAFKEYGIDPNLYASKEFSLEDVLPWEHLDTGITKDFLIKEYKRAISNRIIPDCRYGSCPNCGVCDMEAVRGNKEYGIRPIAKRPEGKTDIRHQTADCRLGNKGLKSDVWSLKSKASSLHPIKVRIKYSKTGNMRMLSQLEVMTTFFRAFRRASVPTAFSEGFHPHPKISFAPALPVGIESICEYMDVELTRMVNIYDFKQELNALLPSGLEISDIREIPVNSPSLNSIIRFYAYEIRFNDIDLVYLHERLDSLQAGELWMQRIVERDGKKITREINVRPFIEDVRWTGDDILFLLLKTRGIECCRPSDVMSALFNISYDDSRVNIRRIGLYGKGNDGMISIFDITGKTAVFSY